jgi:hypothetical protein
MNWFRKHPLSVIAIGVCSLTLALSMTVPIDANFGTSDSIITSVDGHDRAYTTTNRPTNMSVGMLGYNLTTGRLEIANGGSMNNVGDVSDATGNGIAGGANGSIAGAGSASTGTTAGGAGGAEQIKAGAGGAAAGAAAGGAGGATTVLGGAGGATASTSTQAGGVGGSVTITSGAGGNATAGTGNGGAAGSVNIALGTGGTSAGGTAGLNGQIQVNGVSGLEPVSLFYSAPATQPFFVANRNYRIIAITVRPLVAGSDSGAVTAVVNKVVSGTALASGTTVHIGTINLKGTADTNQVLTMSATSSILDLASGSALGLVPTGTTTAATGVVTVLLSPQ